MWRKQRGRGLQHRPDRQISDGCFPRVAGCAAHSPQPAPVSPSQQQPNNGTICMQLRPVNIKRVPTRIHRNKEE